MDGTPTGMSPGHYRFVKEVDVLGEQGARGEPKVLTAEFDIA